MVLNFSGKKENRAYQRMPIHLDINVLNGDSQHIGLVTNLSENGMFFITGANLSAGLNIEVSMTYMEYELIVPVNLIRIKKDNIYAGFGAKLSSPYQSYIDFVYSFKALSEYNLEKR